MSASTRYREIEVRGTPRQMGEQLGEEARDEIRGFDAVALGGSSRRGVRSGASWTRHQQATRNQGLHLHLAEVGQRVGVDAGGVHQVQSGVRGQGPLRPVAAVRVQVGTHRVPHLLRAHACRREPVADLKLPALQSLGDFRGELAPLLVVGGERRIHHHEPAILDILHDFGIPRGRLEERTLPVLAAVRRASRRRSSPG